MPDDLPIASVIEIGCATGEVLAAFPDRLGDGGRSIKKIGFDISPLNITAARARYPEIEFLEKDFSQYAGKSDVVILSDILEHVPDDVGFLQKASSLASIVLLNLPLEDNWTNRNREYGVEDVSGHLRAYSLHDGFSLVEAAGLEVLNWSQIWSHETSFDLRRRELKREYCGFVHSGPPPLRALKAGIYYSARILKPFGRRLFPSNLFLSARRLTQNR
jgi:SAM-dependent methyltransferase